MSASDGDPMLQDLDSTLATLLKQQLPPDLVKQVSISFLTPDGQFPPSGVTLPALDLFLYDIQENHELRDRQPTMERQQSGRVLSWPAPVRVDCSYLCTAWAKGGVPAPDQDEHKMLGELAKVLFRFRELPAEVLQGSMQTQPLPIRALVTQMGQLQSRGEFWQALGGKPRVALNYTVTICADVHQPIDVGNVAVDVRA